MSSVQKLAALVLVLYLLPGPALGAKDSVNRTYHPQAQLDEWEVALADYELRLAELARVYSDLDPQMAGLSKERNEILARLAWISYQKTEIEASLLGLREELSGIVLSSEELGSQLTDLEEMLDLLEAENDELGRMVDSYRESLALESEGSQGGSTNDGNDTVGLSDKVSNGMDGVIDLVRMFGVVLRGGLGQIYYVIGNGLDAFASLELKKRMHSRLPTIPSQKIALMALIGMLLVGFTTIVIQRYWAGGLSLAGVMKLFNPLSLFSEKQHTEDDELFTASQGKPFWNPIREEPDEQISDVDREYVDLLIKLGYSNEAEKVMNAGCGMPSHHYTKRDGTSSRETDHGRFGDLLHGPWGYNRHEIVDAAVRCFVKIRDVVSTKSSKIILKFRGRF